MKRILVPLDGSACAEQVLASVQCLAPLLDAGVHLLRVVPDEEIGPILPESVVALAGSDGPVTVARDRQHEHERLRSEQAESYLAAQAGRFRQHGIAVTLEVQSGHPASAIIQAASQPEVALIAMGTHGWGGIQRWTLGSVANKVAHATSVPILLVRSNSQHALEALRLQQILVPLDGSAAAAIALPVATQLAQRADAALTLLRVVTPTLEIFSHPRPGSAQPSYHAMLTALCDQAQAGLAATSAMLQGQGVRAAPVVATGHPAETIVDEAQRRHVDLIVMATHGTTGVRRWALGSVADTTLHSSTAPLLLVHVGL